MAMSRRSYVTEHEAEQAELLAALRADDDPVSLDLAERIEQCRDTRERLRNLPGDLLTALRQQHQTRYRCRSPACWSCARGIVRAAGKAAADLFVDIDANNENSSLVTVVLARAGSPEDVQAVIAGARQGLRDRRDSAVAHYGRRWHQVTMAGRVEIDVVWPDEVQALGSDRRELLPTLPVFGAGEPWLVAHLHAAVHHPGIGRHELHEVLAEQWPGDYRVHVKPFYDYQICNENAGGVVIYPLKRTLSQISQKVRWPVGVRVAWWRWLHSRRRGLQPLAIKMRARAAEPSAVSRLLRSAVLGDGAMRP